MTFLKKKNSNGNSTKSSYTLRGESIIGISVMLLLVISSFLWFITYYDKWNDFMALIIFPLCLITMYFSWKEDIRKQKKMVIDNQGIHVFCWNTFYKESTTKEIIYRWNDIRYLRYKMEGTSSTTIYLVLIKKQGRESIDISGYMPILYPIGLKILKKKIIQFSGRGDIFKK